MKIKHIEAIAVSLPMLKPMKMSFEAVRSADNVLVRLETDAGIVGWGEAASAPAMTGELVAGMTAAIRYLAPILAGAPANDIPAAMRRADAYLHGNHAAKSAIEMALHDALGRATGKSIAELLGRRLRMSVPMLRLVGTGSTAGDVAEVERKQAEGFVAFKLKVGVDNPRADAARTRAVCEALGGRAVLFCADANQGWSAAQAIEYVQAVADLPLAFFEQPVACDDLEGMAAVARASRIPVGADEGLHTIDDLRRHHAAGAAQGGSLKTIKLGGVRAVYAGAELCASLGMKVNLACKIAESGIATAAVLQLAATVPAIDWGVSLTTQYLADDVLKTPLPLKNGHADVPVGPGLGVEVDEGKVRQYSRPV